ncbi:MAG: glycosyltransferase family 2 protein [Sedimentisphaerales bacterium]|nr:glycosyltransferase family 2 protein [Sedimentisphaerales bacterium]
MQKTESLLVSVVIPAYNSARYIRRALDSVLAQTVPVRQILVIDDGSTDDTAQVVSEYGGRVEYIYQANAGAGAARNTGIQAATSEWIAFLDADDEWLPHRLESQAELLKKHSELVWVGGNFINCVCRTEQRAPSLDLRECEELLMGKEVVENYFQALFGGIDPCTDTILIRRNVLIEAGLFSTDLKRGNDYDMWWRIAYRHPRIGFVCDPLAVYHLDIENSIIHKHTDPTMHADLIRRHLHLAEQYSMTRLFQPVAEQFLRRWARAMLFDERASQIRRFIQPFRSVLPWSWRFRMYLLTICPALTRKGCRMISRIVRRFGLRKKLVRSPDY